MIWFDAAMAAVNVALLLGVVWWLVMDVRRYGIGRHSHGRAAL